MHWRDELRDPGTRANALGLVSNVALTVVKFLLGTIAGSAALVADGFNSAGDILATAIGWAGYRAAQRPPDENHHFGHGKYETVAGLVIGGMLLATGVFVAIEGVRALLAGSTEPPELLAVWIAGGTALLKEGLHRYTSAVGRRLNSPSLLASARDHRADVWVSLTVMAGIVGARVGWPWLDPAAAVLVGAYIAWMAWDPIRTNVGVLMDEAPSELAEDVRRAVIPVEDVREVGAIRVHPLGAQTFVTLEIYVDGSRTLFEAHEVAHAVEARILRDVAYIGGVTVHVNPTGLKPG